MHTKEATTTHIYTHRQPPNIYTDNIYTLPPSIRHVPSTSAKFVHVSILCTRQHTIPHPPTVHRIPSRAATNSGTSSDVPIVGTALLGGCYWLFCWSSSPTASIATRASPVSADPTFRALHVVLVVLQVSTLVVAR